MAIRGQRVIEIRLRKTLNTSYVQVTAISDEAEVLLERFFYRPFWEDRFANLIKAVEREIK